MSADTTKTPQTPQPPVHLVAETQTPAPPAKNKATRQKAAKAAAKPRKQATKPKATPVPAPAKAKVTQARVPKLLKKPALAELHVPKEGTKIGRALKLCSRKNGATLDEIAAELSKTGSAVTASVARSWLTYLHDLGYGLRSELTSTGRLRVWAFTREGAKQSNKPA